MTTRSELRQVYRVQSPTGPRTVVYRALSQISVEDCMTMLVASRLHYYVTGEEVTPPISRDVKDTLIKQNLVI